MVCNTVRKVFHLMLFLALEVSPSLALGVVAAYPLELVFAGRALRLSVYQLAVRAVPLLSDGSRALLTVETSLAVVRFLYESAVVLPHDDQTVGIRTPDLLDLWNCLSFKVGVPVSNQPLSPYSHFFLLVAATTVCLVVFIVFESVFSPGTRIGLLRPAVVGRCLHIVSIVAISAMFSFLESSVDAGDLVNRTVLAYLMNSFVRCHCSLHVLKFRL